MDRKEKIYNQELLSDSEILNSKIGVQLIDNYSRTNPDEACFCMVKAFSELPQEQIGNIMEYRSDLVFTLSRLCFNKSTFEPATLLMLKFASTEKEGAFSYGRMGLQKLFFPRLGATEADLKRRILFIGTCLDKQQYIRETMDMLNCCLSFQTAFFHDGTERLEERQMTPYYPRGEEVREYVKEGVEMLMRYVNTEQQNRVIEILEDHFVEICREGLADVVIPRMVEICAIKQNRWDTMLDKLLLFQEDMQKILEEGMLERYKGLIDVLSSDDFEFRFKRVEKELYNSSSQLSTEKLMGEQRARYKALAEEFVSHKLFTKDLLAKLYETEVISTSPFGEIVARGLTEGQRSEFIVDSIDILNGRENSQKDILVDFTVATEDEEFDVDFYKLLQLKDKRPLYSAVARRSDCFNNKYMDTLLEQVEKRVAPAEFMVSFWSSFRFDKMVDSDIAKWMMRVKGLPGGEKAVLHILQSAIMGEAFKQNPQTVGVALDTVMNVKMDYSSIMSYYQYWNVVRLLLTRGRYPELALHINLIILEYVKTQDGFLINNFEINQTYRLLLSKYFDVVWADLSKVLLSDGEEYWTYHRLKDIMGSMIGGTHNEIGLLFEADHTEALMVWCRQNPGVAPERLMDMAPVFDGDGFSKIVYMLVDEFGQNMKVMNALGHNLGCFGWIGSVIPLYQKELKAVEKLKEHKFEEVRNWAARMLEYLKGEMEKETGM